MARQSAGRRRPPTQEQIDEFKRCYNDFPRFAERYLKIITHDEATGTARLVPFKLNRAQLRLWRMIKSCIDEARPCRIYILKARQLGFSTFVQGFNYWYTSTRPYHNALVVSHDTTSAGSLFTKSKVMYNNMDEALRPQIKNSNRRELYMANPDARASADSQGMQSRILVQTASDPHLGASHTFQILHLSEFARYPEVNSNAGVAMATLQQAVPRAAGTFVFIETTARGYNYARDYWYNESNKFEHMFVSWVADPKYSVREALSADDLSLDEFSVYGDESVLKSIIQRELSLWYPKRSADPEWAEAESLRRLAWRRQILDEQFEGDKDLFDQEYPLTPEQAFVATGSPLFAPRTVAAAIERLGGNERDLVHPSERFNYDPSDDTFAPSSFGDLRVYHQPKPGHWYVVGADVGEGLADGDPSTAQVIELPTRVQVAVLECRLNPKVFAKAVNLLASIYNRAYLSVEATGPGIVTNYELMDDSFYPRLHYRERYDRSTGEYSDVAGWSTNKQTRPLLVEEIRHALESGELQFRDLPTLHQMFTFVRSKTGKYAAEPGVHDDLLMALGIALMMVRTEPEAVGSGRATEGPKELTAGDVLALASGPRTRSFNYGDVGWKP